MTVTGANESTSKCERHKIRKGLTFLDYCVTSNHVHLLVYDSTGGDGIAQSIQLLAGRTGQEYNQRKHRKGAFWEDRYHATAIEGGEHLLRCVVYIDLNMVRAGVAAHPREWAHGGPISSLHLLDDNLKHDFETYGFDEIWIADYTCEEAYGAIDLFCLYPPEWWGYYERKGHSWKPHG